MKKLSRVIGVAVLALSLGSGAVSAATGSISTTGPDSTNQVTVNDEQRSRVNNDNHVRLDNDTYQRASSGRAEVEHNTTSGGASSGDVVNDNLTRATLRLDNTAAATAAVEVSGGLGSVSGSISNTGPDSTNQVTFNSSSSVHVDNDNHISLDNDTHQSAYSGSAEVSGNTTGGSASSGDATNINTSEFTLTIEN